jgi:hypothetical protein
MESISHRMASTVAMSLVAAVTAATAVARAATLPTMAPTTAPTTAPITTPIIDLPSIPSASEFDAAWSISPMAAAAVDEVSRALWWRDTVGLVLGSSTVNDDRVTADLNRLHVGGAWRIPLEHDIDIILRSEVLGSGSDATGWRSGASCRLDMSPGASLEAGAWWTDRSIVELGIPGVGIDAAPSGSAWFGLSLRF